MDTEVLRCVHRAVKNGVAQAQCAAAAEWQCVRCGMGYCHRHALWHRKRQAAEPAPGPDAVHVQVSLALALQTASIEEGGL